MVSIVKLKLSVSFFSFQSETAPCVNIVHRNGEFETLPITLAKNESCA